MVGNGLEGPGNEGLSAAEAEAKAEAEAFWREQGYIEMEERLEAMKAALTPEERARLEKYEPELDAAQAAILSWEEVQKLAGRTQLAGKSDPGLVEENAPGGVIVKKAVKHNRLEHSMLDAYLARIGGIKAGLPLETIKTMEAAALLHDVGHSAFSHIGDRLLGQYKFAEGHYEETDEVDEDNNDAGQWTFPGYEEHEERGIRIVETQLAERLEQLEIKPQEVARIIREEGADGQLQSALDTLSYMVLDSGSFQAQAYPDHGVSVLKTIKGLDEGEGNVVVDDIEPWQELLNNRAQAFQDYIYHPQNKMLEHAKMELLDLAIMKGYVSLDEVENDTDDELWMRIQSLVQVDSGAAVMGGRHEDTEPHLALYKDLWSCAHGVLPENWEKRLYDNEEEARAAVEKIHIQSAGMARLRPRGFVVEPYNYTKKTISLTVEDENGRRVETVKAEGVELREEDKAWVVYTPRN